MGVVMQGVCVCGCVKACVFVIMLFSVCIYVFLCVY